MDDPGYQTGEMYHVSFFGRWTTLMGMYIVNFFLSLVTFGIYSCWGRAKIRRYMCSQTELDGERFAYHGTGKELLLGMCKAALILLPIGGALLYFLPLHFAYAGTYAVVLVCIPYAMVSAMRYRLSRTSWRGIRFGFYGRAGEYYRLLLAGAVLTVLSFGVYIPYWRVRLRDFWLNNIAYGTLPLQYTGDGRELWKIYRPFWLLAFTAVALLVGAAVLSALHLLSPFAVPVMMLPAYLIYLGLMISWLWLVAAEQRYHWDNTYGAGAQFRYWITGGALMWRRFLYGLIMALTAGLAYPWVQVNQLEFFLSRLTLHGDLDLEAIEQAANTVGTGTAGEGVVDAMDIGGVDFGLG